MKKIIMVMVMFMVMACSMSVYASEDFYNPNSGMWENGEEIPTDLSDGDLYDWEIEHGFISEAREQYCETCGVWAKYGTCPICNENVWGKIENKNPVSEKKTVVAKKKTVVKKSKGMTKAKAKKIIRRKKKIHIDRIKLVDKYVKGKWYCYYVYADGDCYIVTIKRGKVQKFVQLN